MTTARDLAQLKADKLRTDPQYRAQVEAVDRARSERGRALDLSEAPIVAELRSLGVTVSSVWDLVNTTEPYPEALPVLLAHLEKGGYLARVMESLGRALAVKPSVAWWDRLRDLYRSSRCPGEEDGLAVALAACATKAQLGDLVDFLSLEERGDSRIYFLRPINRVGGERGRQLVDSLRDHPTFGREATALSSRRRRARGG